jgi:hypothetical protein
MLNIWQRYAVHPDFFRVLFSFGEEPHLAEASSNYLAMHCDEVDRQTCKQSQDKF